MQTENIYPYIDFIYQYLNELPPRNSRSKDVGGTWRSGIGRIYFRNFFKRYAVAYSSQFTGTCSNIGSAYNLMTANSNNIAVLNITSAFS